MPNFPNIWRSLTLVSTSKICSRSKPPCSFDQITNLFDPAADSYEPSGEKEFNDKGGCVFSFRDFDDSSTFDAPPKPPTPVKKPDVKKEEPQMSLKRYFLIRSMPPHADAPKSKMLKRESSLMATPQVKERPKLFTSERRTVACKQQTPKFTAESSIPSFPASKVTPVEQVDGELYGEELRRLESLRSQVEQLSSGPNTKEIISKCQVVRGYYLAAELKIAQAMARTVSLTNRILSLQVPEFELMLEELLQDN